MLGLTSAKLMGVHSGVDSGRGRPSHRDRQTRRGLSRASRTPLPTPEGGGGTLTPYRRCRAFTLEARKANGSARRSKPALPPQYAALAAARAHGDRNHCCCFGGGGREWGGWGCGGREIVSPRGRCYPKPKSSAFGVASPSFVGGCAPGPRRHDDGGAAAAVSALRFLRRQFSRPITACGEVQRRCRRHGALAVECFLRRWQTNRESRRTRPAPARVTERCASTMSRSLSSRPRQRPRSPNFSSTWRRARPASWVRHGAGQEHEVSAAAAVHDPIGPGVIDVGGLAELRRKTSARRIGLGRRRRCCSVPARART